MKIGKLCSVCKKEISLTGIANTKGELYCTHCFDIISMKMDEARAEVLRDYEKEIDKWELGGLTMEEVINNLKKQYGN